MIDLLLNHFIELRVTGEIALLLTILFIYAKYKLAIREILSLSRAGRSFLLGESVLSDRRIVNPEAKSLLNLLQISSLKKNRDESTESPILNVAADNQSSLDQLAISLLISARSLLVSSATAARVYLRKKGMLNLVSETGPKVLRFWSIVEENIEWFDRSNKLIETQIQNQSLMSFDIRSQLFLKFPVSESEGDLELVLWFGFKDVLETNYQIEKNAIENLVNKARLLILQFEKISNLEKELVDERDSFIGISHDLKTPGVTALYLLRELQTKSILEESISKRCLEIELLVMEQLSLIQDFLDLEQTDKLSIAVRSDTIDLTQFIESISDSPIVRSRDSKILFRTEVAASLLVKFDRNHLKRIILNLLTNSFKYTESGEVVLGLKACGSSYELFVSDTGRGINPDLQSVLFSKFSRLDAPSDIPGVGIGLSASKLLAEKNGAALQYFPRDCGGSIFSISIPPGLVLRGSELLPSVKQEISNKSILILEDDEATCRMYSRVFSANGLVSEFESTLAGARDKLFSDKKYDALVCDLRLSDGESCSLLGELFQSGYSIPTLVISGASEFAIEDDKVLRKIKESSSIRYLTKPIDRIELEMMLDEVLVG